LRLTWGKELAKRLDLIEAERLLPTEGNPCQWGRERKRDSDRQTDRQSEGDGE